MLFHEHTKSVPNSVFAFAIPPSKKALLQDNCNYSSTPSLLLLHVLHPTVSISESLPLTITIAPPPLCNPLTRFIFFHDLYHCLMYSTFLFLHLSLSSPLQCMKAGNCFVLFTIVYLAPRDSCALKILAAIHF